MKVNRNENFTISQMVDLFGEIPQSEDLYVLRRKENQNSTVIDQSIRFDGYSILIAIEGETHLQVNLVDYHIKKHDALLIPPNTLIFKPRTKNNTSSDFDVLSLSFTTSFAILNGIRENGMDNFDFLALKFPPKIQLTQNQIKTITTLLEILQQKNVANKEDHFNNEFISHLFRAILYEFGSAYKKFAFNNEIEISSKGNIVYRFLKLIELNFKINRSVQFYADSLHITPGHLNKVLKETSGKNTRELIDDIVLMEAKNLMMNNNFTVKEISNELQFSNPSFFGKFFKKKTGLSPKKYKMQLLK